jgi:hypothetical protein
MVELPAKPESVSHVSDAHWEAALDAALKCAGDFGRVHESLNQGYIDHARCLILLGEVDEPKDPVDEAIDAAWSEFKGDGGGWEFMRPAFSIAIRAHVIPALEKRNG